MSNRRVIFVRRPERELRADDFRIEDAPMPVAQAGQVLLRTVYLSMDPYMLLQMQGSGRYGGQATGSPMHGRAVSRVVKSGSDRVAVGDHVLSYVDWAEHNVADPDTLIPLDATRVPLPAYLGAVGHSGITAWAGICDVARAQAGETVVVSAASGAVGSVAGQIARIRGCRVVGIAGGAQKARHVVEDLRFHACVDHRDPAWPDRLREAAPDGVDVYFENVGGAVLDAVLVQLNRHARIALCGLVAHYTGREPLALRHFRSLLEKAIRLEGFSVADYIHRRESIVDDLANWVAQGQLVHRETIVTGIDQAPAAMVRMLQGDKFGKQLVQVSDPAA